MTVTDKIKLTFLTFLTLGFIWIWIKKKSPTQNKLSTTNKTKVNIESIIQAIKKENFVVATNTQNKIKITIKDYSIIDKNKLQNLKGVSGTIFTSKSVHLIIGNSAKKITDNLNKKFG